MKVLIFYAKYGGGHLSAARSIESCINENFKNIDVELIDFMEYASKEFNKITTRAYSEMAKKAPKTWGHLYWESQKGPLAHISTTSNKILSIKLKKLITEKGPDLIISTHPFSSQICGFLKKHNKINCKIATVITDFASHDQWLVYNNYIDYFFVACNEMENELYEKGITKNKVFVTGIPISNRFLFNYDKKTLFKDFNLSPNKKTILFFGGGEFGLGKERTVAILKAFLEKVPDYQIVAAAGKNEKMKEAFENLVQECHAQDRVRVLGFTDKVPELMHIASIVVSKPGGLTTTETLACELPMIVINPIPGQEEENAEFLEQKGAGVWIRAKDSPDEILISLFKDNEKLEDMKKNAKLLAKKNSTKEICELILKN